VSGFGTGRMPISDFSFDHSKIEDTTINAVNNMNNVSAQTFRNETVNAFLDDRKVDALDFDGFLNQIVRT
jgi:hypothetical protein